MSNELELAAGDLAIRLATEEVRYKDFTGDIEVKTANTNGKMQFSGWVSTDQPDLVDDVCPSKAFVKYLPFYKNNPIYCYQHDKHIPIGKVEEVEVKSNGIYLNDITLTPVPIVKEVIWPLVYDKVLKQQSIGFFSLKGEYRGDLFYHDEIYLLECSLVSVACNPGANIDIVKSIPGFDRYKNISELMLGYERKEFKLPSEVSKNFYVDGTKKEEKDVISENVPINSSGMMGVCQTCGHEQDMTLPPCEVCGSYDVVAMAGTPGTDKGVGDVKPDFVDVKAIKLTYDNKQFYDPDGKAIKVNKISKKYHVSSELTHAAYRMVGTEKSYLFTIGVATDKGFRLDFSKVAVSMCRLMGVKGNADYDPVEKSAIVERLCDCYRILDKEIPTYQEGPLDDVQESILTTLKFSDITWKMGEASTLAASIFNTDVVSMYNQVTGLAKNKTALPEGTKLNVIKTFRAYFDLYGSDYGMEEADLTALLSTLIDMGRKLNAGFSITARPNADEYEDDEDAVVSIYEMDADDTDKITKMTPEQQKVTTDFMESLKALA